MDYFFKDNTSFSYVSLLCSHTHTHTHICFNHFQSMSKSFDSLIFFSHLKVKIPKFFRVVVVVFFFFFLCRFFADPLHVQTMVYLSNSNIKDYNNLWNGIIS